MLKREVFYMQKIILWMIATMVAILTLGSCAPDPIYSYPPKYEKKVRFTLDDPKTILLDKQDAIDFVTSCQRGDSITALIRVEYTGSLITRADYYWTLKGEDGPNPRMRIISFFLDASLW